MQFEEEISRCCGHFLYSLVGETLEVLAYSLSLGIYGPWQHVKAFGVRMAVQGTLKQKDRSFHSAQ
jgi:hypothetical protein